MPRAQRIAQRQPLALRDLPFAAVVQESSDERLVPAGRLNLGDAGEVAAGFEDGSPYLGGLRMWL